MQESHQYFQGKLKTILEEAKKTTVFSEAHSVKTVILNDGTEVRYFGEDAYRGPSVEDFITRINFLCNVAKLVKDVEQIERTREKFIQTARNMLDITLDGANFSEVAEEAKKIISQLQAELVGIIYPDEEYAKGIKALNKAAQKYQIKHPRPIIVHVMPNGFIDAQFPKDKDKTFPGDYPRGKGVIPNAVFEIMGHFESEENLHVDFVGSRAASYSTFNDSKEGERNNIENTRKDLIQTLQGLGIKFRTNQIVPISSVSLLSPLTSAVTFLATKVKRGHVSERLQLAQQQRALKALNGKPLTIIVNNKPVIVFPQINLVNFNVKPPEDVEGREEIIDDKMIKKINEEGIKQYIAQQETFLNISEPKPADLPILINQTLEAITKNADPAKKKQLIHTLYFYDVLQQYYTKSYKKVKGGAYFIAAQIIRSTEMAGIIPFWNCKTTKDRSGWEAVYIQLLVEAELKGQGVTSADQQEAWFKRNINKIHEFSVSLEATSKNAPGARGNRVNDPTGSDKRKINSIMSGFAKIKHSKKSVIKHLAKASSEGLLTDELVNNLLQSISDDLLRKMIDKLKLIENNYLKTAIISCIDTEQLAIPENIDEIIEELNEFFPKTAKPEVFFENVDAFLAKAKNIPWLKELQQALFIDFMKNNKVPSLPDDQKINDYIESVSKLIVFISKIDIDKAKKLAKFLSKLHARQEELMETELQTPKNKWAEKQTNLTLSRGAFKKTELEKIYVYEKNAKQRAEVEPRDFIEEDDFDKHIVYQYKNGVEYKTPGNEIDPKALQDAVDIAIKKFSADKLSDLKFGGNPKIIEAARRYAATRLSLEKPAMDNFFELSRRGIPGAA